MADSSDLLAEILAAPLGATIASIGQGVAEAQAALDASSLQTTLELYERQDDEGLALLREIGYQPTFYTLPETVCEVKVSVRLANDPDAASAAPPSLSTEKKTLQTTALLRRSTLTRAPRMYAAAVDAGFQQRYGYQAEAAAKLTFKVVPVPPPAGLENMRRLPDLVGMGADVAGHLLLDRGFEPRLRGSRDAVYELDTAGTRDKIVQSQNPAAGQIQSLGSTVELTIVGKAATD